MYDPKFEKAIQQKMEELEFRPPEAVWVNIEKAVMVKRRRRAGYIWRYLLPAVFVVAAAGLWWYYGKTSQGATQATQTPAVPAKTTESAAQTPETPALTKESAPQTTETPAKGPVSASIAVGSSLRQDRQSSDHGRNGTGQPTYKAGQTTAADETQVPDQTSTTGQGVTPEELTAGASRREYAQGAGQMGQTGSEALSAWFYLPGLADQRLAPQVRGSALKTKKSNTAAMAGLSHPQGRWEAGFVAGGGISRLDKINNNQMVNALANAPTTSFAALSYQGSNNKHYVSDIRPGASFEGGIYLQRALSDRFVFNTGMNLHYYSNSISIGQQVTTYAQSSASLFVASSASAQSQSMYKAGNSQSYTNKYYFLELPVGLQWKINKSHLMPIFVEGGVSLSRLMGANSLLYDENSGLYTKDGDIVKKTQFNIESALLIGLPFHGVDIQLGPQIQYGLTPLVNAQGVGNQHFLYTGIRLVIIPGRK